MAITKEEKAEIGRRAAASWIEQRRADPEKMKKWQRAMRLGRLRAAREKKQLAAKHKETTVAKSKADGRGRAKGSHWAKDPKRARLAALKGARTRKRLRLARERELAGRDAQRRVVEHHNPEDLVHLDFPVVPGTRAARQTNGGYEGDDVTQLTPTHRKQLALEGLRFVKILLE